MDKMRIYELARELKVENKDVINYAKKLGLEVKSHMSTIEGDILKKVKEKFTSDSLPKTDKKQVKKSDEKEKKESHKQEVVKTSDKDNAKKDIKKKKTRKLFRQRQHSPKGSYSWGDYCCWHACDFSERNSTFGPDRASSSQYNAEKAWDCSN